MKTSPRQAATPQHRPRPRGSDRRPQSHRDRQTCAGQAMKLQQCQFLHLAAATIALIFGALSSNSAWSQTARPIKVVVPSPAGGSSDVLLRLLGEAISRAKGPRVVIENRPGAGTIIATEAVARAAPDGATVLNAQTPFIINSLLRKVNYDPMTSFEPICHLVSEHTVIVVNSASPYRSLGDLIDAARGQPGALTGASLPASPSQFVFETFKRAANVDMTFVPYPGGAPAINALLGGHLTFIVTPYAGISEQLKAGRLRPLAVHSQMRIEALPDVPTLGELGYNTFNGEVWNGLVAPAKTPKETISRLADWFSAALRVPDVAEKLAALGQHPLGLCGADFAAFLHKQYDEYGRVIREANIKAE
jgi:tripartite-type tricarboxylate transporter receptor subunit TctC